MAAQVRSRLASAFRRLDARAFYLTDRVVWFAISNTKAILFRL